MPAQAHAEDAHQDQQQGELDREGEDLHQQGLEHQDLRRCVGVEHEVPALGEGVGGSGRRVGEEVERNDAGQDEEPEVLDLPEQVRVREDDVEHRRHGQGVEEVPPIPRREFFSWARNAARVVW